MAQTSLNSLSSVVNVVAPEKLIAKKGSTQPVVFTVQVKTTYHVNSNKPEDEYLIPLKFTFTSDAGVEMTGIEYPKPSMQKLSFSEKPVSVFEGDFRTTATLKVGPAAAPGLSSIMGKLRYQACNDRMCLPPRTLDIKVPLEIRN